MLQRINIYILCANQLILHLLSPFGHTIPPERIHVPIAKVGVFFLEVIGRFTRGFVCFFVSLDDNNYNIHLRSMRVSYLVCFGTFSAGFQHNLYHIQSYYVSRVFAFVYHSKKEHSHECSFLYLIYFRIHQLFSTPSYIEHVFALYQYMSAISHYP